MKQGKRNKKEETNTGLPEKDTAVSADMAAEILAEMRAMRQDFAGKLERIDASMREVKEVVKSLENRIEESEQRISASEDRSDRTERLLTYMLTKQRQLEGKCEDLESRSRRSNIRIYGVKEGAEGEKIMAEFIDNLLKNLLDLPADQDLGIECAHRSLTTAPTDPKASPRSIVVKFLHFPTKQQILFKAWSKKGLKYEGNIISLDNDYSLDIQRRRKEYRDMKRQLKERRIKFRSPYPALLKVSLETGEKTFHSAWEAAEGLKHLGITVNLSESELVKKELSQVGWLAQGQIRGRHLTRRVLSDMRALTT